MAGDVNVDPLGALFHQAAVEALLEVAEVELVDTRLQVETGQHEVALASRAATFQARVGQCLEPDARDAGKIGAERERVVVVVRQFAGGENRGVILYLQLTAVGRLGGVRLEPPPAVKPSGLPDLPPQRRLPLFALGLEPGQGLIELGLVPGQRGLELLNLCRLFWRRHLDSGLHVAASALRHCVEEGKQSVKLVLRNRVILVIVAARASDGEAEPDSAGRLDAIDDVLDLRLGGDRTALPVEHVVAVEAGGDELAERRLGQQVAGELLDGELVERHVAVQRIDDPVAPMPLVACAVGLEAVGVGVAGGVEPRLRHVLAVARRRNQSIDQALVGAWRRVDGERLDLGRRRRQAGEIKRGTSDEGAPGSDRRRCELPGAKPVQDEMVDRVERPAASPRLAKRKAGALGRDEGPVVLPLGTLLNPAPDQLLLAVGESTAGVGRRHDVIRVVGGDAAVNLALAWLAVDERAHAVFVTKCIGLGIEPQLGLALVGVRPVALVTVVGEDRADVAVELDGADINGMGWVTNERKQAGKQGCHGQRAPGRLALPSRHGLTLGELVADGLTGAGGRSFISNSSIPRDGLYSAAGRSLTQSPLLSASRWSFLASTTSKTVAAIRISTITGSQMLQLTRVRKSVS